MASKKEVELRTIYISKAWLEYLLFSIILRHAAKNPTLEAAMILTYKPRLDISSTQLSFLNECMLGNLLRSKRDQ
jgi:hypothetical protein